MKVLSINEDNASVQQPAVQSKPNVDLPNCDVGADCNTESDHGCDCYSGNG
jgi:hypothetical protein